MDVVKPSLTCKTMTILPINDKAATALAISEIHQSPILVQLPTVFALLAAPTSKGVAQLDSLKSRLGGKNYGTVIGSLDNFIAQAQKDYLPDAFTSAKHYARLNGAFIRLPFRDKAFQSETIKNGTHQGLLLAGAYSDLLIKIEESFAGYPPDKIWGDRNYNAPLGTSCNVSGDPDGSIVSFDKALSFAKSRGVKLFLTTTKQAAQKGSYPILGFEKHKVTIHRQGPSLEAFKARIPAYLRSW